MLYRKEYRRLVRKCEAKQVGDIYHVAELSIAGKIADSDQLGLKGHSFFTREKNFNIVAHHFTNNVFISVRFTVDGDKLLLNIFLYPKLTMSKIGQSMINKQSIFSKLIFFKFNIPFILSI